MCRLLVSRPDTSTNIMVNKTIQIKNPDIVTLGSLNWLASLYQMKQRWFSQGIVFLEMCCWFHITISFKDGFSDNNHLAVTQFTSLGSVFRYQFKSSQLVRRNFRSGKILLKLINLMKRKIKIVVSWDWTKGKLYFDHKPAIIQVDHAYLMTLDTKKLLKHQLTCMDYNPHFDVS